MTTDLYQGANCSHCILNVVIHSAIKLLHPKWQIKDQNIYICPTLQLFLSQSCQIVVARCQRFAGCVELRPSVRRVSGFNRDSAVTAEPHTDRSPKPFPKLQKDKKAKRQKDKKIKRQKDKPRAALRPLSKTFSQIAGNPKY